MKKSFSNLLKSFVLVTFCFSAALAADRFDRSGVIPAEPLDPGGFGNVVAGVDLDGDGKLEIYSVNDDWYDIPGFDLVPRIYKYEMTDGRWEIVWWTRLDFDFQNTWPALDVADLDQDGRGEIVWGPVNNFTGGNSNPDRIVVFETAGDGSDVLGVDDGAGGYTPNASWTIETGNDINRRPFRWFVTDIDNDGTDEIVAALRAGDAGLQVYSTNDVPDDADGSETWTLEFSGLSGTFYDLAIIGSTAYAIQSNGDVWPVTATAPDTYAEGAVISGGAPNGSWKSATVVDIDGDGTEEILVASWNSSTSDVYLLQEDGAGGLTTTLLVDVPDTAFRLYGGAAGDVDSDGLLDFVFGTRQSTPNGQIYRMEYQGGDITDGANYELQVIDQGVSPAVQYDIVVVANLDDDSDDEVIYSGIPRGLSENDPPQPIVVLDRIPGNQPVIQAVADVPNDQGRQVWVIWRGAEDDVGGLRMSASLSGENFAPPVATTGHGRATFTLSEDQTQLHYMVEAYNITGITQAHIHQGGPDENGPVGTFLFGFLDGGTGTVNGVLSRGTITEADLVGPWAGNMSAFLSDLLSGNTYVNVHTVANPGGEIRGQIRTEQLSKKPASASGYTISHYIVWRIDGGQYPVQVSRTDAIQAAAYASVVPTLGDSTMSTYVVTAHTPNVTVLWKSFPKRGFSVDNLAPVAPTNLTATEIEPDEGNFNVLLQWDESPDEDFQYFAVYKSEESGFDPATLSPSAFVTTNEYVDGDVAVGEDFFYRVVAFDFNGNQGEFSEEVGLVLTAVDDQPAAGLPTSFALDQNYPNPFNPSTQISYDLAESGPVTLQIFNLSGQLVKTLVDKDQLRGRYSVTWDGTSENGVRVASGVYLYVIKAGDFSQSHRMTLLK